MDLQKKIEDLIERDKLMHFCVGLLLAQLAYVWVWFILLPVSVGIAKEGYDEYVRKTGFDWGDLLATCLGCVPVMLTMLFLKLCIDSQF